MRKTTWILLSLILVGFMLSFMGVVSAEEIHITQWNSLSEQISGGNGGIFSLTISDDGTFSEPRSKGIYLVEVKFDKDAGFLSKDNIKIVGLDKDGNPVDLSNINIQFSNSIGGNNALIKFTPALPDYARYKIKIVGVSGLSGDTDRVLTALKGDAYQDLRVTSTDLSRINAQQGNFTSNSPPTDQIRSDINNDGVVNSLDLNESFKYSGHDARYISEPIIPEVSCTDSDGGLNYYFKGYVPMYCATGATCGIDSDYCKDDKTLVEYTCDNWKTYNNFENYICPNGCKDGACIQEGNNTLACPSTKCDDGTVYACKMVNGICSCPTCPSKPVCSDSDGGKNYYVKGSVKDETGERFDYCKSSDGFDYVTEYFCSGSGINAYEAYKCPNGCSNGACVPGEEISEQVTCIFKNSNKEEKCYTAYQNERAYCSGIDSCVANIKGYKGEQITWKSTCGQYLYTTQDGQAEKIEFECSACQSTAGKCYDGTPIECKIIDGNCVCSTCPGKLECKDSDGGKEIYKKGTTYGLDWGTNNKVEKTDYCITEGEKAGRLAEYFCQLSNGVYQVASESFGPENGCYSCSEGACQQIIVKPVCGNGICESGEGDVCACPETKISCVEGKECKVPACVCSVSCPQDCKKTEGIYAKLNEKFKLQVYQPVKITENENHLMKITFKDLIAYKCEEEVMTKEAKKAIETRVAVAEATITGRIVSETSASGGGQGVTAQQPTSILKCIGAGPKALLNVEMIVNGEINKQMVLNLNLEEKKQIDEFTISFLSYDYASRTGVFLVSRETFSCKKGCKCDGKGRVIECWNETCKEGQTLCPDGICKEKCNIISEDCKFGCMYEGKCFPMGVRSKGLYCSEDLIMNQQRESDKSCENNFECSSNVCVAGKCISSNFIQKILNWFRKLFGGG